MIDDARRDFVFYAISVWIIVLIGRAELRSHPWAVEHHAGGVTTPSAGIGRRSSDQPLPDPFSALNAPTRTREWISSCHGEERSDAQIGVDATDLGGVERSVRIGLDASRSRCPSSRGPGDGTPGGDGLRFAASRIARSSCVISSASISCRPRPNRCGASRLSGTSGDVAAETR